MGSSATQVKLFVPVCKYRVRIFEIRGMTTGEFHLLCPPSHAEGGALCWKGGALILFFAGTLVFSYSFTCLNRVFGTIKRCTTQMELMCRVFEKKTINAFRGKVLTDFFLV